MPQASDPLPSASFLPVDAALRARASRVIPGGLWGHMNARLLPEGYPQFFVRAEGCRLHDADGRLFVDLMNAWGPVVLGHCHPVVEAAARAQAAQGDCMNGPAPVLVDLAELIVDLMPHAAWCIFAKNGSDATTLALTLARAETGRRKVLVARGAYHGSLPWCTPGIAGVTAEDRAHLRHYDFNDVAGLEAAVERAGTDLAAILVSGFRHDVGRRHEMPTPAFAQRARALCDETRAALILDEVRTGFRLDLAGTWETLGVRPDLAAWSKAIANGHALAAVTGQERFRAAAQEVYASGSFWYGAVAMAAAVATLTELRRIDGTARMAVLGQRLRDGLAERASHHGLRIDQSGPPQMPLLLFADDPEFRRANAFCAEALRHGAYFHPRHTMFLSCAHTEEDIDFALDAADAGFRHLTR